jgi:predicted nucleic acid-binding Zn ribbon protein
MAYRTFPPAECANCGAAIPRSARVCPECGADEHTGWRETSVYDDLDLPDSAYEHDRARQPRRGLAWYWIVTAIVAIAAAILFSLGGR